jgi:hypothetical protein
MAAVQELRGHFPDKYIHLEADANFVVAMEPNECAEAQAACDRGEVELVVRDRQADNWLLNLADKYDAIVVTADNLTPFTGPYPWILHWGRVWGPEYSRRFDRWGFGPRILDRENRSTKGRLDPREINQTQALRQSVDYGIADKSELQEPLMQLDMEWYTEPNQHEVDCTLTTANGMLEVTEQSRATGYSFNNSRFEISWCTAPLGRFGTNLRRTSLSNSFLNVEVEEDGEVFLVSRSSSDGDIEWWSSLPYRHPDRRRNSHSSSLQPTPNWAIEASLDGRMVGVNEIGSEDIWFVSTSRQAVPYERKTSREVIALGEVSNSRPCWGLANDFYSLSRTGKLFVGLAEHEIAWHPPDSKSKPGRYRIVGSLLVGCRSEYRTTNTCGGG